MIFWILISVLTALAALSVLVPLTRSRATATEANANADEAVYREQLAAIDRELAQGLIDPEAAEAARTETARRLLSVHDRSEAGSHQTVSKLRTRSVQLAALIALPAAALGLYLAIGSPELEDQPLAARFDQPAEEQPVEVLVARVERHLADDPEDGQGWAVIAPVYMRLGQPQRSAQAYANAIRLLGPRADWLTDLGEALTVANEGVVTDRARSAFEHAVELEPRAVKPHFFLAIALGQEGRNDAAISAWETLLEGADPQAAWVAVARRELANLTGKTPALMPALRGPSEEEVAAASEMSAGDRQIMIKSMVHGLAARIDANGGTVAEWEQLMRSYVVLDDRVKANETLQRAEKVFAEKPADLARIKDAAIDLGLTGS
ncbi:c-type cytochrome biogenesis protein CcmI [Labrenzia sp. PHM005]|uniref:c-type cytochrome biogenesis protein CcmI n=1 Tax=Labrenzia sp. PHM005 TaxID=2590016 RepID=UPI00114032B1|nr:c-type cytochrome biogenesis protein CcmI [Labrenzia sp. PHM005]QDG78399.1 c-type cytochrome biogenesis protein CcmI [Labrenzia sp. PHM005]